MCLILLDWLEDPIILPCCGKVISKIPLHECVKDQAEGERKCPNCARTLGNFNILNSPVSLNILNIVKRFKESNPLILQTRNHPAKLVLNEKVGLIGWNMKVQHIKLFWVN